MMDRLPGCSRARGIFCRSFLSPEVWRELDNAGFLGPSLESATLILFRRRKNTIVLLHLGVVERQRLRRINRLLGQPSIIMPCAFNFPLPAVLRRIFSDHRHDNPTAQERNFLPDREWTSDFVGRNDERLDDPGHDFLPPPPSPAIRFLVSLPHDVEIFDALLNRWRGPGAST